MQYIVECEIIKTTSQVVRAYVDAKNKAEARKIVAKDSILDVGEVFDEELTEDVNYKEKILSIEKEEA